MIVCASLFQRPYRMHSIENYFGAVESKGAASPKTPIRSFSRKWEMRKHAAYARCLRILRLNSRFNCSTSFAISASCSGRR